MKKIVALAFVVLSAAACTPTEIHAYLTAQNVEVPVIAPTDRDAGLSLPATARTEVVHGETVNVVAYVTETGEADGYFVYDGAGGRWLVMANAQPAHAYVYRVTADRCFADPFGTFVYDPAACGAIPIP